MKSTGANCRLMKPHYSMRHYSSCVMHVQIDEEKARCYEPFLNCVTCVLKVHRRLATHSACARQVARRFALGVAQTMLAVGYDGQVYAQAVRLITPETEWTLSGNGSLDGIAADASWVYGINKEDRRVYKQHISKLTPSSDWELLSEGPCLDIAVDGDMMYGAMMDGCVWSQNLTSLPHFAKNVSAWQRRSGPHVVSLAVSNGSIYGVGGGGDLWKQSLDEMNASTTWNRISQGR
eukprot:6458721-Amphidinium_carterae.1